MNLYTIVFEDNTSLSAGTIETPKWIEIPNKKIRTIFYSLPLGDMLCLSGFKRIYHYVEVVKDLNGLERGKVKIEYSYLIIERDNKYIQYKVNQNSANIDVTIFPPQNEYIERLNPNGWR